MDSTVICKHLCVCCSMMTLTFITFQIFSYRLPGCRPVVFALIIPQINIASRLIKLVKNITQDSSLAVESMQSMQQIITSQSESMAETQNIVKEVLGEINSSMQSIKQIKASTRRLEDSRNEVVQAVGELSGIAEENVESTKKTYDGTQEVVGTFQQVYVSAEQLREISDKLVKGIGYFHI